MRDQFLKLRTSKLEKNIIKNKARKAGLSTSEFIRRVALEKEVKARLSKEEIESYTTLIKYKNNFKSISNFLRLGDVDKVKEKSLETAELINRHLNKFK